MPFADPSVIQGFQPVELPDQQNMLLKALQAQSLVGQNRLQGIQQQSAQLDLDGTNAIRNTLASQKYQDSDPSTRAQLLTQADPFKASKLLQQQTEYAKSQTDLAAAETSHQVALHAQAAQIVGAAASNGPDAVAAAVKGSNILPDSLKSDVLATMPSDRSDPAFSQKYGQWANQVVQSGLTAEQQLSRNDSSFMQTDQGIVALNKRDGTGKLVTSAPATAATTPTTIDQPYMGQQPVGNFAGDPATVYAAIQRISNPADRAGALRAFQNQLAGANPTSGPNGMQGAGAATPVQLSGTPGVPPPSSINGNPQPLGAKRQEFDYRTDATTGQTIAGAKYGAPGSTAPPQATVVQAAGGNAPGQLSSQDQSIVDKIGNYELAPFSSAARNPRQMNIMAAVADQHPEYDATQYGAKVGALKAFSTGPQGNALRSVSVASDHLDQLAQAASALQNTNIPIANKIANAFGANVTNATAPGVFNAIKQIVGDEVVKAVIGGGAGGVTDRAELAANLNAASTPDQLAAVIRSYRTLMGAQKDALISQYEHTTGRTDAATRFNFKSGGSATGGAGWSIEKVN